MRLKHFTLLFLIAVVHFSCKKGDPGPTGNANVVNKIVSITTWSQPLPHAYDSYDQAIPEITQDILDKGAVLVYEGNSNSWNAVPFSNNNDQWRYVLSPGNIRFVYLHGDGSPVTTDPGAHTFKVVIIAGS